MTKLLIGIVLFSLFVAVLGGTYYAMTSTYDVPSSNKWSAYNKLGSIANQTTSIGTQYQTGNLQQVNTLILGGSAAYSALQILLQSASIPIEIIKQVAVDFPFIPQIFFWSMIVILGILIIYAIGSALTRWVL